VTLPYSLEEVTALVREFEKIPQIAYFTSDDVRLANIMWDPFATQKQLSFIDIGTHGIDPYSKLSVAHPAQFLYMMLNEMEQTFLKYKLPEYAQTELLSSFHEGYYSLAKQSISRDAMELFRVIYSYRDLEFVVDDFFTQMASAEEIAKSAQGICARMAREKRSHLILKWPVAE
jgi:hypothetical protein